MTPAERAARERAAQGLDRTITDPSALARIAALMTHDHYDTQEAA